MERFTQRFNKFRSHPIRKYALAITLPVFLFFFFNLSSTGAITITQSAGQDTSKEGSRSAVAREMTTSLIEMNSRYQLGSKISRIQIADDLRSLAESRERLLSEMIEADPAEVLRVALPDSIRSGLPASVRKRIEQRVDMEGMLEVIYSCGESTSRLDYSIEVGEKKYSLHFAGSPSSDLMTGAKVRVKGVRVGDAIALEPDSDSLSEVEGSGFQTMAPAYPNTFGEQKVLVILVNFQDKQTQPFTVEQVRSVVFGSVNNFYKETSYQQTSIAGDVYGWFTMPISSSTCDRTQIATYARQAAQAAGVNLSAYNRHVFAFPSISCGWTGWGTYGGNPSQAWINGSMSLRTVGHELGHNFGLYHARALECGSQVVGDGCSIIEYGNTVDILGKSGVTGHSHAFQKERLGWLEYGVSPKITTVQSSGNYWIDPYESQGTNAKALKILKSVDSATGRKTWYFVEVRRPVGFDSFVSSNSNVMNGVLINIGTESSAAENYLLDMTPETTSWSDPALVVGRSYSDSSVGVTITTLSVDSTGAVVNVSFGPQPCTQANPSMTLSPSQSQWVRAGTAVTYTVTVKNNNSQSCGNSNFDLTASVPGEWSAVFASPMLSIAPGASATTTLQVTSPTLAGEGFYNIGVTARNNGSSSYAATGSLSYVIVSSLGVNVSSDQSSYTKTQTASMTAVVSVGGSPVAGANVTFTLTKPNGAVVSGTATSSSNGSAVYRYRFNKKQDPTGTYQVSARANLNGISGNGTTSFVVR